ncbi:hypothetical protein F4780DRAFT_775828 [Xylariomycetidae sp. FL0641]|nr:hypothetical protein F4780DRAFT_775828 [Xylariomycetidae sp. FL0641]
MDHSKLKSSMEQAISGSFPRRKSIQEYGLERVPLKLDSKEPAFMQPFLNARGLANEWQSFEVVDPRDRAATELVKYGVCARAGAYVTYACQLNRGSAGTVGVGVARFVAMRYRDMVPANYHAAGGNLRELRWLGIKMIVDPGVRAEIARVFAARGQTINRKGAVALRPDEDDPLFAQVTKNIVYLQSQLEMVRAHADRTGDAYVKRIVFLSRGVGGVATDVPPSTFWPQLHIVTELARPSGLPEPEEEELPPKDDSSLLGKIRRTFSAMSSKSGRSGK